MSYRGAPSYRIREEAAIREGSQRRSYASEKEALKKRIVELETALNDCTKKNEELENQLREHEKNKI